MAMAMKLRFLYNINKQIMWKVSSLRIRPNTDTEILRERIFVLLNAAPHDASPKLLNLLAQYLQGRSLCCIMFTIVSV